MSDSIAWPPDGPVDLRDGLALGGGRGVFANQTLRAGQLLLTESPLVTVPTDKASDESLHVSLARAALQTPARAALLLQAAPLHPVRLSDLPPEGLQRARQHYEAEVGRLLDLIPPAAAGEGAVQADDVLRLILAVQCNAFYSGLYVHCSMFNHACNPSCIKLARPDGTSEVRALRDIQRDGECTISYLAPPLQSFQRRARHLQEQHYFQLAGPSAFPPWAEQLPSAGALQGLASELRLLVDAPAPGAAAAAADAGPGTAAAEAGPGNPSSGSKTAPRPPVPDASSCPEAALGELPEDEEGQRVLERLEDRVDELEAQAAAALSAAAKATRQEVEELLRGAEQLQEVAGKLVGSRHLAAVRLDLVVVAAARQLLLAVEDPAGQEAARVGLALLGAAARLKETQEELLGAQHYDLALTLEDLHQTLGYMLSNCPKALFAAFPAWASFPKASLAEAQAKKRHKQIKTLYST